MHPILMNYAARHTAVAVLAVLFILVAVVCWLGFRRSSRPWLFPILGAYNLLLLALFMLGVVRDDGYGWAFLPFMVAAAPWSFVAPIVAHGPLGWLVSGIAGNFVLFVVICGGVNSMLLYALSRRILYPSSQPVRPSLL
jgi:hypothetical protein